MLASLFKWPVLSGVLSVLMYLPAAWAADAASVNDWLDLMNRSMRQQNYQGTLIIRQADKLQAIRVKQGVSAQGNWQTLESLTGENQKIIRHKGQVTTIFPGKKLVTISDDTAIAGETSPLHATLPDNYRELKQYYAMKLAGEDRVADKSAQIIQIIPRDRHRYGYTYWLDKQTGILLKCDLMDEKGRILEQLMYSNIDLLPESPLSNIEEPALSHYKMIRLPREVESQRKHWRAGQLPDGFELSRFVEMPVETGAVSAYHIVYTDGMASVSVFIEQRDKMSKPVMGASSMGTVNAYSIYINDAYITAIGEVPAATVRMIAQSMQPVQ